jgi:hypothetical protein
LMAIYQGLIALLLVAGLVPGLVFISQHRPRQWRRLAAWDASGFVLVAVAIYLRSLILLVSRWPGSPPKGWGDGVFAVVSLAVIDGLFILRLVSYRSFVEADRASAAPADEPRGQI